MEAFKYFVNKNPSNPIIIAAHSQGTNHAVRLINEYISLNKNLQKRLVLSYLIGMNIEKDELKIEVCKSANETDCFMAGEALMNRIIQTWRYGSNISSVNPISFSTDSIWSSKDKHMGILMPNQKLDSKNHHRHKPFWNIMG